MSSDSDELFEALLKDVAKAPSVTGAETVAPPKRLGRYHLLRKIGAGGMGSVYLAQLQSEHGFERAVAVKLLHRDLAEDDLLVERFLDEARTASRIFHTNVCQILDVGTDAGQSYLVMEYLRGEPLSTLIAAAQPKPLPFEIAARIVADAARGLSGAHSARTDSGASMGIVHRDIKPSNIVVLFEGISKVVDFGIAFARERQTDSAANELRGTLAYMAPEQLRDEDIDQRVDLWSLGVTLWEATTGRRLFDKRSLRELQGQLLFGAIPDPRTIVADYPDALAQIVADCLERDREKRMASAAEMADRLEGFLFERGVGGHGAVAQWVADHMKEEISERHVLEQATLPITSMTDRIASNETFASGAPAAGASDQGARTSPSHKWLALGAIALVAGASFIAYAVLRGTDDVADPPTAVASTVSEPNVAAKSVAASNPAASELENDAGRLRESPTDASVAVGRLNTRTSGAKPTRRMRARGAQPGTLDLMVIPSAEVYFKGRKLGQSPLRGTKLPAGTHTLLLRATDGRSKRLRVKIRAAQHSRMSVALND